MRRTAYCRRTTTTTTFHKLVTPKNPRALKEEAAMASTPTYFELGVIVHEDGDDSDVRHEPGDDKNADGQELH